jgi:pimeloyl-ACP methyl ester carboxylesterase
MDLESGFFIYKNGIRIHYRTGGSGPGQLLFLHGFAASHTTWIDIVRFFPVDKFRIFILDMKGFGLSDKPRDGAYSIEDQADMVRAFIKEQGLSKVTLIGHSLGGGVALRACLQALEEKEPISIDKLVLLDCAAYPQRLPRFFRRLKFPFLGPLFFRLIPARIMVQRAMEMVFYDQSAITPERFERYRLYFRGKGLAYTLRATIKRIDPQRYVNIGEQYGRISVPALIIWGEMDRIVKLKYGLMLHQDLPGSRLKIIEKCGHNPHEERPAECYAAIEEFLAEECNQRQ